MLIGIGSATGDSLKDKGSSRAVDGRLWINAPNSTHIGVRSDYCSPVVMSICRQELVSHRLDYGWVGPQLSDGRDNEERGDRDARQSPLQKSSLLSSTPNTARNKAAVVTEEGD
jgi:hypothetical protein